MKTRSLWCLAAILIALGACGGAEMMTGKAEQGIGFPHDRIIPPDLPPLVPYPGLIDRLMWVRNGGGDGALWLLDQYGHSYNQTRTFPEASHWYPAGVAGNRILWQQTNGQTSLWTMDANGQFVTVHWLANPDPSHGTRAVGLSVAQSYLGQCLTTDDTQNYYVTWDTPGYGSHPLGEVTVQLIDGTGYVRRSTTQDKPFAGATALWFGKSADAYEKMLFRDNQGSARTFRAQWNGSVAPPRYDLIDGRSFSRPGYQAVSMNTHTYYGYFLFGDPGYDDQILFTSLNYATDGGRAVLATFDYQGNDLAIDRNFSGGNGWAATSYTSLPLVCP